MRRYPLLPNCIFAELFFSPLAVEQNGGVITGSPMISGRFVPTVADPLIAYKASTLRATAKLAVRVKFRTPSTFTKTSYLITKHATVSQFDVFLLSSGYVEVSFGGAASNGYYKIDPNTDYDMVFNFDGTQATNATKQTLSVNGGASTAFNGYNGTVPSIIPADSSPINIGGYNNVGAMQTGIVVYETEVFTCALTDKEALNLYKNTTGSELDAANALIYLPFTSNYQDAASGEYRTKNIGSLGGYALLGIDGKNAGYFPTQISPGGMYLSDAWRGVRMPMTQALPAEFSMVFFCCFMSVGNTWIIDQEAFNTTGFDVAIDPSVGKVDARFNGKDHIRASGVGLWGTHLLTITVKSGAIRARIDGNPLNLTNAMDINAITAIKDIFFGFNHLGMYGAAGSTLYTVAIYPFILTPTQDAILTSKFKKKLPDGASAHRAPISFPKSNLHYPTPLDLTGKCVLHWGMGRDDILSDGKMLDRSGNGRHGTVSQAQKVYNAPFDCLQFNQALASNVSLANGYTDTISGNQNMAVDFRVKTDDLTSIPVIICNSDGLFNIELSSGTIYVQNGANTRTYSVPGCGNGKWMHIYFEKVGAGNTGNLYVNNVLQSSYTGTLGDIPTTASSLLKVGGYYGGASYHLLGKMVDLRVYSSNLTAAERTKLYLDGAKRLVNRNCLCDAAASLSNVTAGQIPTTNIEVISGSHKISNDGTKNWLEVVSAGGAAWPQNMAYGTWVFDVSLPTLATESSMMFIAMTKSIYTGSTQNGYFAYFFTNGTLYLFRTINGSTQAVISSAAGYLTAGATYRIVVTRSLAGVFNLYIKGGAYASWTLVGTGTDVATTSSKYAVWQGSTQKERGFYALAGVIDPTVNPELIPN